MSFICFCRETKNQTWQKKNKNKVFLNIFFKEVKKQLFETTKMLLKLQKIAKRAQGVFAS